MRHAHCVTSACRGRYRRGRGRVVAAAPAGNPTPVTTDTISALLRAAWAGKELR